MSGTPNLLLQAPDFEIEIKGWSTMSRVLACAFFLLAATMARAADGAPGSPKPAPVDPGCEAIARLSNKQLLVDKLRETTPRGDPKFEGNQLPSGTLSAVVDVDGDQRPEFIYVVGAGSPRFYSATGSALRVRSDLETGGEMDPQSEAPFFGAFMLDGRTYLLFGTNHKPRFAAVYRKPALHVVCEFEPALNSTSVRVGDAYTALRNEAARAGVGEWEYAINAPGMRRLEILYARGLDLNDPALPRPLLYEAYSASRLDISESLLRHGADPSSGPAPDTPPLYLLLQPQRGDFVRAAKLFEAGANPRLFIDDLAKLIESEVSVPDQLVLAAVKSLQAIPEAILLSATHRPSLLTGLTKLRLPVQPEYEEWHGGRRIALRPDAIAKFEETPGALEKVRALYANPIRARRNFARFHYGTSERGWEVQRLEENPISDNEMLLFATAFCAHFFPEDCGAPELERRALAWAQALSPACGRPEFMRSMGLGACNTIEFYLRGATPGSDFPMEFEPTGKNWDPALMPYSFEKLYRAKHPSR
jgi:hypothetical protein